MQIRGSKSSEIFLKENAEAAEVESNLARQCYISSTTGQSLSPFLWYYHRLRRDEQSNSRSGRGLPLCSIVLTYNIAQALFWVLENSSQHSAITSCVKLKELLLCIYCQHDLYHSNSPVALNRDVANQRNKGRFYSISSNNLYSLKHFSC